MMILFKLDCSRLESMKRVFSVTFMIAILATMAVVTAIDTAIPDAEAFKKGKGVYNQKYGSATKGIVCGDRLCSEVGQAVVGSPSSSYASMSSGGGGAISIDSVIGATIKDTEVDGQSGTAVVLIDAQDDGKIMLNIPPAIKDAFMVIVDGEEWDDAHIDGNKVKVYFYAGAEKIEIIGNVLVG